MTWVILPFLSVTVVPVEPSAVLLISVTVPSFFVSMVEVEPSGFLVTSVTVPVVLLTVVVVTEPSGFFSVVGVVLEELPPEELPPLEEAATVPTSE